MVGGPPRPLPTLQAVATQVEHHDPVFEGGTQGDTCPIAEFLLPLLLWGLPTLGIVPVWTAGAPPQRQERLLLEGWRQKNGERTTRNRTWTERGGCVSCDIFVGSGWGGGEEYTILKRSLQGFKRSLQGFKVCYSASNIHSSHRRRECSRGIVNSPLESRVFCERRFLV